MPSNADPIYDAAGAEWNVDPDLLRAVAGQETGGSKNPDAAVSAKGATGRMGIMPGTGQDLGVTDPTSKVQSIYGAAKLLSQHLDKYKSPALALAAYNAGASRVDDHLTNGRPLPDETAAYVPSVAKKYQALKAQAANTNSASDPAEEFFNAAQKEDTATPTEDPAEKFFTAAQAGGEPPAPPETDGFATFDPRKPLSSTNSPVALTPLGKENLQAGLAHGLQSVPNTLERWAAAADKRFPALARLDSSLGFDPMGDAAAQPAAEAAYAAKTAGSPTAEAGDLLGTGIAVAPALAAGGAVLGGIGDAASGLGMFGRGVQGVTNLLQGTATAPAGAGLVPRALVRGTSLAASGAAAGGTAAGLTGGDVGQGALTGAVLAPGGALLAEMPGAAGNLLSKAYRQGKSLIGRPSTEAADEVFENAAARSGAPDASPAAPTAPDPYGLNAEAARNAPPAAPSVNPTGPESVGAAATSPTDLTTNAPTAAQLEAQRSAGFQARMAQGPNTRFDNAEYVPGSVPTVAEQLADPEAASLYRLVQPGDKRFTKLDQDNNDARLHFLDNLAGNDVTLQNLEDARAAQAEHDLSGVWANKKDADATPVVDQITQILSGPNGKLTPVRQALSDVSSVLQKADDSGPEADPEMLYGVRKQINYLLSKNGQRANPAYADATVVSSLMKVRNALDQAIEPAAPGFSQYLKNYSDASREIDKQEFLQSVIPRMRDVKNKVTLNGVNSVMKDIGKRLRATGPNKAKSIDDDTMDQLFNLRSDLLRESNRDLGKARGSDTFHNQTLGGETGLNLPQMGAHALASHVPFGNVLLSPQIARNIATSNAKIKNHIANRLLNSYPLENPLSAGTGQNTALQHGVFYDTASGSP